MRHEGRSRGRQGSRLWDGPSYGEEFANKRDSCAANLIRDSVCYIWYKRWLILLGALTRDSERIPLDVPCIAVLNLPLDRHFAQ